METRRQKKARAALTDKCRHEALANFKAERAPLRSRVGQTEIKTGRGIALVALGGTSGPKIRPKPRKRA
jgi:hypothetical protein